jgi:hypothetical protein
VVLDDSESESIDQSLDCSGAMEVQGDLDDVANDSIDDEVNGLGVSDLDDFLAQVVPELVVHDSRDDWQHALNQALQESALTILVGAVHGCLDHLLKHSAASLIEAIEVEIVEHLLLLLAEAGDHLLNGRSLLLLALLRSNLGFSIRAGDPRGVERRWDGQVLAFVVFLIEVEAVGDVGKDLFSK